MAVPNYYVSDFLTEGWCEPLARIGKDVIGVMRCDNPQNLGYNCEPVGLAWANAVT